MTAANDLAPTVIHIGELYGQKKVANLTIENARFWGRPNFNGDLDQFKNTNRKFTVIIPNDVADDVRTLGWNVKHKLKTLVGHDEKNSPIYQWDNLPSVASVAAAGGLSDDQELISSMRVMVDMSPEKDIQGKGSKVWMSLGSGPAEQLNSRTAGAIDRSRIVKFDCEIRAWEYDPEDEPGKYSARLVECVAVVELNRIQQIHGRLGGPATGNTIIIPEAPADSKP